MPIFDSLKRASFGGIDFPVRSVDVKGSLRYHVHEYPHTPGGQLEILERKLYEIDMDAPMHATIATYPNLYPAGLKALRTLYENGESAQLYIPTLGAITAVIVEFDTKMDPRAIGRSGENLRLKLIEDQSSVFLVQGLIQAEQKNVGIANTDLSTQVAALKADDPVTFGQIQDNLAASGFPTDIFDQINLLANQVFAIRDQLDLFNMQLDAKIQGLQRLIEEADSALQDMTLFPLHDSLMGLWDAADQFSKDLLLKNGDLKTYTVPRLMAVNDVSVAIYGDNSHAVAILQTNNIDDAFAIQAGTQIRYYPNAA